MLNTNVRTGFTGLRPGTGSAGLNGFRGGVASAEAGSAALSAVRSVRLQSCPPNAVLRFDWNRTNNLLRELCLTGAAHSCTGWFAQTVRKAKRG